MQYVPYHALRDRPNIVVDGAACEHTLITLSHWPGSGVPEVLRDDLSAQIVFHYLDRPDLWVNAELVSNNHFDEDGLVGIYALLNPRAAQAQRDLLIDVAAAGDFGTYRLREAARIAFVISAFADPDRSPLDSNIFRERYPTMSARLYEELLPRLSEIVTGVDRFRPYWESEDASLQQSEELIQDGKIVVEEIPTLDLAVITLPESMPIKELHLVALHNALHSFRVLLIQGRTYQLQYRYESWVQYVSRRPLPRIDLSPLAEKLSDMESGNARWKFEGVDEITPKLALEGSNESRIPPQEFISHIKEFLFLTARN